MFSQKNLNKKTDFVLETKILTLLLLSFCAYSEKYESKVFLSNRFIPLDVCDCIHASIGSMFTLLNLTFSLPKCIESAVECNWNSQISQSGKICFLFLKKIFFWKNEHFNIAKGYSFDVESVSKSFISWNCFFGFYRVFFFGEKWESFGRWKKKMMNRVLFLRKNLISSLWKLP